MATKALLLAAIIFILGAIPVQAAPYVFILRNTGRIEGEWINRDDTMAIEDHIQTADGLIVIAKSRVEKRIAVSPTEQQYEKKLAEMPDSAAAHKDLAEWCEKNRLGAKAAAHWKRVVELDGENVIARRKLGYVLHNGEWMTSDERRERRGTIVVNGKEVLPQEAELMEKQRQFKEAEQNWFKQITRIMRQIDTKDREKYQEARKELAAISDPHALKPLLIHFERDKRVDVRLALLQALRNVATLESLSKIVSASLQDKSEDIRLMAFEVLGKYQGDHKIKLTNQYIAALKSKDNDEVQRAAIGLRYVWHPGAVGPLIEALVTEHTYIITPPGSSGPNSITSSFNKSGGGIGGGIGGGGGGLSVGNRPQRVKKQMQNQEVLGTLVQRTGADYSFDQKAWKRWLAAQRKDTSIDARRD